MSHQPPASRRTRRRILGAAAALTAIASATPAPAAAATLPDGWGWEWVSTVDTMGRGVLAGTLTGDAASNRALLLDADHLVWQAVDPFAEAGAGAADPYLSTRTPHGWTTTKLSPLRADNELYQLREVAGDGTTMAFKVQTAVQLGPGKKAPRALARRDGDGQFSELVRVSSVGLLDYIGMSDDGARAAYSSSEPPPGLPSTGDIQQVYVTDRSGQSEPVAVDGAGDPLSICPEGSYALEAKQRAISEDGRTVFFASQGDDCTQQAGIWARRGSQTVSVVPPSPGFDGLPVLLGIRPDGSSAYVSSGQALTADDTNGGLDYYRADLGGGGAPATLHCVTCDLQERPTEGRVSVNGTLAFRLKDAASGKQAVYGYDGSALEELYLGAELDGSGPPFDTKLDLSPDGRTVLAVMPAEVGGIELRRIRWGGGQAPSSDCLTCRPDGLPSSGLYGLPDQRPGPDSSAVARPQSMSSDGRSIIFASVDALAAGAEPGEAGTGNGNAVVNLYRWREDTSPPVRYLGRVRTGPGPLASIDDSGNSVFVTLSDAVAPEAQAIGVTSNEWYVARLGGGFPLPPTPGCDGDGCRSAPAPAPLLPQVGSGVAGPGNALPPIAPVPTGKVEVGKSATGRGASATLTVRAPGAGRISVSGRGIRTARAVATKAAGYRVKLRLSGAGKRALKRTSRLRVPVTVRFAPSAGVASSARASVTFVRAKRRSTKAPARSASTRSASKDEQGSR